jgi:hypothetical protein
MWLGYSEEFPHYMTQGETLEERNGFPVVMRSRYNASYGDGGHFHHCSGQE